MILWIFGRIWVNTVNYYFCVDAVDKCFCAGTFFSVSVLVILNGIFLCVDVDLVHYYVGMYFQSSC